MKTIYRKTCVLAALTAMFFIPAFATPSAREVREYDGVYPDAISEQGFLRDSTQWIGTAWLKCIEEKEYWEGTNLNHFGNEHSTVRLTDCEFTLSYYSEPTSIRVAVELKDDEDSQKPAFYARDLRQGTYYFEKIKGDGTLRARTMDQYSASAIVLKNYDQFEGSIETGCAVVFGDVEDPERSDTGRIVIPEGKTVTIAEGKHFTTQELNIDGTLIMNGALNVSTVSGSGTVVLPAEIDYGMDISSYGCDESTIRFSNDFTGYFSAGHYFRGNLDLGGNTITFMDGKITVPYVFNRLVGDGIIDIGGTAQPITILEVLDTDTYDIAYKGRIIGDTSNVTLPEGFTLDSRGYIVKEGTDHHYVTVPKTVSGVYVPAVTDVTKGFELEDVEEENYEYYVYRVPAGDVITVDITAPYANVVMTSETHFETAVNKDIDLPLPTGYTAGFLGLKTRGEYVHEIWYDENWVSPTDGAMPYPPPVPVAGYCSAVHNGNFVGRNLDYFVNDMPTFVVHVAASGTNRFASVGIGSARLHNADVAEYTAEYSLPPLGIFDGINENGVVIEENVVPFDDVGALEGTNPGKPDLHIVYVPRYILDHATSAAHAIKLLEERNLVGDLLGAFSFHYLIADKDESYVVEFIDSKLVWRKMEISTNFNLCWDNEKKAAITDETGGAWTKNDYPAPYDEKTTIDDIKKFYTDYAMGVERFVTLREHYDEGNTREGMMNLMKRVQYSQTYSIETAEEKAKGPSWWVSESCSADYPFPTYITKDGEEIDVDRSLPQLYELFKTDYEYFANIIAAYDMAFGQIVLENVDEYRYDFTGIWYTTHTAVYDIANRSLSLCVQEGYDKPYDFKITNPGHVEAAGLTVEGGQVVYKAMASSAPTKTYQLKRTQDLTTPMENWEVIAVATADEAEITLVDQNPPEKQAFYTIREIEE